MILNRSAWFLNRRNSLAFISEGFRRVARYRAMRSELSPYPGARIGSTVLGVAVCSDSGGGVAAGVESEVVDCAAALSVA